MQIASEPRSPDGISPFKCVLKLLFKNHIKCQIKVLEIVLFKMLVLDSLYIYIYIFLYVYNIYFIYAVICYLLCLKYVYVFLVTMHIYIMYIYFSHTYIQCFFLLNSLSLSKLFIITFCLVYKVCM